MDKSEINHIQRLIDEVFHDIINTRDDICKCEKCTSAIRELILTNVKSHFINGHEDIIHARTQTNDLQIKADIFRETAYAIDNLKKNPLH